MSLQFWNNPIVVSALRLNYRRGSPLRSLSMYVLILAVGGAILEHYNYLLPGTFPRNYFIGLMGLQFVLSAFSSMAVTAASIRMEVVNRTLDFQRVAAVSP